MNLNEETESETLNPQNLANGIDLKQSFQIEYAMFFNRVTGSRHHQSHFGPGLCDQRLMPESNLGKRRARFGGAWLSSSSLRASLFLFSYTPDSPLVLLISLNGKIHEEHFISKLHLSWPQISSDTVKGGRVVLASYKDSFGQMQKFAMRFLDSSQSEVFIESLKDLMQNVVTVGLPSSNYFYKVPSGNEAAIESNPAHTAGDDTLLEQPSGVHAEGNTRTILPGLSGPERDTGRKSLPSLSVFVDNICNTNHQGATKPAKVPLEADLFSGLVKDLPGDVFNAMLNELESFIHGQERDLAVQV